MTTEQALVHLYAIIARYGDHDDECERNDTSKKEFARNCTCGFDDALEKVPDAIAAFDQPNPLDVLALA